MYYLYILVTPILCSALKLLFYLSIILKILLSSLVSSSVIKNLTVTLFIFVRYRNKRTLVCVFAIQITAKALSHSSANVFNFTLPIHGSTAPNSLKPPHISLVRRVSKHSWRCVAIHRINGSCIIFSWRQNVALWPLLNLSFVLYFSIVFLIQIVYLHI